MPPKRKLVIKEINTEQICDYLLTKDQILEKNSQDLFTVFQEKESYKYLKNIGLDQVSAATEWISIPSEEVRKEARMHYDRIQQVTLTLEDEFDEVIKEKLSGAFRATIKEEILKFIRRQSSVAGDRSSENILDEESFIDDEEISEIIIDQESSFVNEDDSEIIPYKQTTLVEDDDYEIGSHVNEADSEIILHRQASLDDENGSEIISDRQGAFVENNNSEITMDFLNGVEDANGSDSFVDVINGGVKIKQERISDNEDEKIKTKKTNAALLSGSSIEEICLYSPLSSVHTSDLSSFDDEISISSEEGNEKRRVSLKFAEEEIQRVMENRVSESHKQEKRKKTKKRTENGHQSQEESSDSTSATSSSRRVRKPNSKYYSKDVLSPFDVGNNSNTPATNAVPTPINNQDASSVSRKRGRPRKSTGSETVNSNHVSSTFDVSQDDKDNSATTRKRGRPRKHSVI